MHDRRLEIANEVMATAIVFFMVAALLGPVVPIAVIGSTFGLIFLNRHQAVRWRTVAIFAAIPLWAVVSTLWSPAPGITLKYSVQLLLTVIALLSAAIALRSPAFLRAVLWASLMCTVVSIASNIQGPSAKGPVLVGITGSKDSMASCAYLLLLSGGAAASWRQQPGLVRLIGLASLPIAIYVLSTTNAASLIVASVVTVVFVLALTVLSLLPMRARLPAVLAGVLLLSPAVAFRDKVVGGVLATFEKDRTLTGRTQLWEVANTRSAERPIVGWGYRYIFMSYGSDSIGMLHGQSLTDARTFNFHNTYLELKADLGWIGMLLGIASLYGTLLLLIYRAVFEGGTFWIAAAGYVAATIGRSFGETLFQSFSVYGPLLLAFGAYALLAPAARPVAVGKQWTRRHRKVDPPELFLKA